MFFHSFLGGTQVGQDKEFNCFKILESNLPNYSPCHLGMWEKNIWSLFLLSVHIQVSHNSSFLLTGSITWKSGCLLSFRFFSPPEIFLFQCLEVLFVRVQMWQKLLTGFQAVLAAEAKDVGWITDQFFQGRIWGREFEKTPSNLSETWKNLLSLSCWQRP